MSDDRATGLLVMSFAAVELDFSVITDVEISKGIFY